MKQLIRLSAFPGRTREDVRLRMSFAPSTSGCQLSLQLVDESLQFKKTPYFELLPPLILLSGDDVKKCY